MSLVLVEDSEIVKTSWRLPKTFVKKIKQYALDHDTTVTAVLIEALDEFFNKKSVKK
jgi:predicted DNA-binding ribbon-helix-helix protein